MIERWYLDNLVCPRDHEALTLEGHMLVCSEGHRYQVVDGIPVMLLDDVSPTASFVSGSPGYASGPGRSSELASGLYLESIGISDEERAGVVDLAEKGGPIDPVVAYLIAATNGLMYKHLIGRLDYYPIPDIPLPPGNGDLLLDIGCGWGRWSIAASRRGYSAIGIDPSLGAVMAARRVARQLRTQNLYVVGDARFLPFREGTFDQAFSYSVIQHFSTTDAARSVGEIGRILKHSGRAKIQMPTRFGARCLYHQMRRGFREPVGFEVRYWTIPALRRMFADGVGNPEIEVDCYFGIGLQASDAALLPVRLRSVLWASELLKSMSKAVRPLRWIADSVFAEAVKERAG